MDEKRDERKLTDAVRRMCALDPTWSCPGARLGRKRERRLNHRVAEFMRLIERRHRHG